MSKVAAMAMVSIVCVSGASLSWAQAEKEPGGKATPQEVSGAWTVSAKESKGLVKSGVVVVDTRSAADYAAGHIPGAISAPYEERSEKSPDFNRSKDKFDLERLPSVKSEVVLFYCGSANCWSSYKAAKMAVDSGWGEARWFRGGMQEWMDAGLPVEKGAPKK